ncbi:hypothetical protein BJ742DRAFT_766030 [Cladochytrium replicatum]|nr:hypothetical protein BJ742DRAFT_766030 [Cladochytrium replicatum]
MNVVKVLEVVTDPVDPTHKGAVTEAFPPFHVDLTVSDASELSDEIILGKVQAMSGSKSFVK